MDEMDNRKKGYIYADLLDCILYLVLSVIYPGLTFLFDLELLVPADMSLVPENLMHDLLVTALFYAATFFYDFFSRYRDCGQNTRYVVNVLGTGRVIFFVMTVFSIFALCFFEKLSVCVALFIIRAVFLLSCYPFVLALIETLKRGWEQNKGKISKAAP